MLSANQTRCLKTFFSTAALPRPKLPALDCFCSIAGFLFFEGSNYCINISRAFHLFYKRSCFLVDYFDNTKRIDAEKLDS